MFEQSLVLPIALGVIVVGLFYLIVSHWYGAAEQNNEGEQLEPKRQVQCPNCQRWKKMQPIRQEDPLDEVDLEKVILLPGRQHRVLHEYKCPFCGHIWQEQYLV